MSGPERNSGLSEVGANPTQTEEGGKPEHNHVASIRHRRQPSVYYSVHTHFLPKTGEVRQCQGMPTSPFCSFFWFYDMFNDVMNLYIQNGLKKGY